MCRRDGCDVDRIYNVWYQGTGNLYGGYCAEHAAEEILKWKDTDTPVRTIKPYDGGALDKPIYGGGFWPGAGQGVGKPEEE